MGNTIRIPKEVFGFHPRRLEDRPTFSVLLTCMVLLVAAKGEGSGHPRAVSTDMITLAPSGLPADTGRDARQCKMPASLLGD